MRSAALAVVLSLIAPSVARIACGWNCIGQAAHAASCHEHERGDRNTLASGSSTPCHDDHTSIVALGASSTPNGALFVDMSVPGYSGPRLSSCTTTSRSASDPPGTRLTFVQLRI